MIHFASIKGWLLQDRSLLSVSIDLRRNRVVGPCGGKIQEVSWTSDFMQITSTLPSRPIILQLKVYVKLFASWSVRWGSRRNLEIHQAKSVSLCHLVAKNTRRAGCIWWRVLTPPDTPLEKSRLVHSWKQSKAGSKAIRCIFTLHVFML